MNPTHDKTSTPAIVTIAILMMLCGAAASEADYPSLVGADLLHDAGITGRGVTVAVIDTGRYSHSGLNRNASGDNRVLAQYDAIRDELVWWESDDDNGHGGHVSAVIASSKSSSGRYEGIAPGADLVLVKALDAGGRGTYAGVIRGVQWVIDNRDSYGIRVLNLSLSAEVRSHYWDDPLNQALMAAWDAGIVVVASAGNAGPDPMTVGVPGNNPYVITVGAMTDSYTPQDAGDDRLASFSAAGPTYEAFLKPEVVAPGGHVRALMDDSARIAALHPELRDGGSYFTMSGTSQAAAVVSGIAALVLEADPTLTPDGVKCRLIASARPAFAGPEVLAYSVFQQGAGLIDAPAAIASTAAGCANGGLDVAQDLAGTLHYAGPAREAADGSFYVEGWSGFDWNGSYAAGDGYFWSNGGLWSNGYFWSNANILWGAGYFWSNANILWSNGYFWSNGEPSASGYFWSNADPQAAGYFWSNADPSAAGYFWSNALTEPVAINRWVDNE